MEKKILTAVTIVFFIVMLAFTFISRKTAIELLPRVEAVYAEDGVTAISPLCKRLTRVT